MAKWPVAPQSHTKATSGSYPNGADLKSEGYVEPEHMIRLDQFPYRSFEKPHELDFAVDRIPRGLFDGELSKELKDAYVVLEKSDAKFHVGGIGN